jgi:phosphoadenosine phosphosulfate reductase
MTQTFAPTLPANPTDAELDRLNATLTNSSPQAIIKWALNEFGSDLILACSFGGITGMALLDMAVKLDPAIRVFYLDTDFLFPETHALQETARRRYSIFPVAFKSRLTPALQAERYGEALWERDPDLCCDIRKVEPTHRALQGSRAWLTGLRAPDQASTRQNVRVVEWDAQFGLYKISPLWNWTEEMVWIYLRSEDVPYNALHEQGYPSIGCTNCTRPVAAGEDSRAGRWRGISKTECGLHKKASSHELRAAS